MIDKSKPWFPSDFPLDEVLAAIEDLPFANDAENLARRQQIADQYETRLIGPAKIFFDLRQDLIKEMDAEFRIHPEKVTMHVGTALIKLMGSSIPQTLFTVNEYAVPVVCRDVPTTLLEEVRPVKTNAVQVYWDMVAEDSAVQEPTA
jgi:hypothetical protein